MAGTLTTGVINGVVTAALPWQDELGDGDKGIALLEQGLNDAGQGLGGVEGGVVKQDDGARPHLAHHPLGNLLRRQLFPVQTVTVPDSFKT